MILINKLQKQIEWWKHYTFINESSLDNNPSPGNKKGGLTTILEKSLGAVAKSGTSVDAGCSRLCRTFKEKRI